jgi:hypothetical protein
MCGFLQGFWSPQSVTNVHNRHGKMMEEKKKEEEEEEEEKHEEAIFYPCSIYKI